MINDRYKNQGRNHRYIANLTDDNLHVEEVKMKVICSDKWKTNINKLHWSLSYQPFREAIIIFDLQGLSPSTIAV